MQTAMEVLNERVGGQVHGVLPDQSVLSVAQFMKFKNIGAVAVIRENALLGVISERDIMNKVVGPGLDPREILAAEIMSKDLTFASPEDTTSECLMKMRRAHCRHVPVVKEGHFFGLLSLRDVLGSDEEQLLDRYLWERNARDAYSALA